MSALQSSVIALFIFALAFIFVLNVLLRIRARYLNRMIKVVPCSLPSQVPNINTLSDSDRTN
jgi:hypothetical protein